MAPDPQAPDPRAEVQQRVVELIAHVVLFNHAVAQRLQLGSSDAQFMTLLQVNGPMTPSELATATGLSSGTVTGVLDRLERADLVHRERHPGDRRKVVIRRDEAEIARQLGPMYREQGEFLAGILDERSDDEATVIASFLTDLLAAPTQPT